MWDLSYSAYGGEDDPNAVHLTLVIPITAVLKQTRKLAYHTFDS